MRRAGCPVDTHRKSERHSIDVSLPHTCRSTVALFPAKLLHCAFCHSRKAIHSISDRRGNSGSKVLRKCLPTALSNSVEDNPGFSSSACSMGSSHKTIIPHSEAGANVAFVESPAIAKTLVTAIANTPVPSVHYSCPHLPQECLQAVFSLCSAQTLCRCAAVSKEWRAAANSDSTWQAMAPTICMLRKHLHCLSSAENPLTAISWLRNGIVDEAAGSILTVDPATHDPTVTVPQCNYLPLCSLSRSIIKYTTQKETVGYSGRLGSILLLWLHQVQRILKPHFCILPGTYLVSLRVGGSREEVECMHEASVEGQVHLSEGDVRLGGDMQSAVELFAGMDLLAESPCSDLLMLCRRRAMQTDGEGSSSRVSRYADVDDSSASQLTGKARQRVVYSGPIMGGKGPIQEVVARGLPTRKVTWNQRLEYVHRYSARVGLIVGEVQLLRKAWGTETGDSGTAGCMEHVHLELDSKFREGMLDL